MKHSLVDSAAVAPSADAPIFCPVGENTITSANVMWLVHATAAFRCCSDTR